MIKRVQRVRHIKSAADLFLGRVGEITVNTTDNAARVHDGATVGGIEQARKDMVNVPAATGAVDGKMTATQASDLSTVKSDFATHDGSIDGHPVADASDDGFMSSADKVILDAHIGSGGAAHADVVAGGADGFMTGADKTKLNGIETAAKNDQTGSEILALLLPVDGASSGLDADKLRNETPTSGATADTIVRRNSAARSQFASPNAAADVAIKSYVDAVIPTGTVMLFFQNDAPVGWTRVTTHNNKAFRVVSASGGGSAGGDGFTTVFGTGKVTGNVTLSAAQSGSAAHSHGVGSYAAASNGAHTHLQGNAQNDLGGSSFSRNRLDAAVQGNDAPTFTASDGAHTHTVTGTSAAAAAVAATASHNHTRGSMNLQYINIVMGSKN